MHRHKRRRQQESGRQFGRSGYRRPKHNIPVNIIEEDSYFEAWVYCLTFSKEEVKIMVAEDMIYISGRRTPKDDAPNFLLQEYPIKSFERFFELSERADKENITAKFEEGILKIHVPKTAAAQRGMQEVKIE
ncbi:MAG: Hsp20/alpha crystallin family protein [Bacteroidota bacterium]